MESLISIVIPAYNAGAFIKNCLNSILNQSYKNFEVIAVNDGSKDNTLEILEEYAKRDSRIKPFTQENGGVSSARNKGLENANGEFITFVDADDSIPENALSDLVSLMSEDIDFVVGSHYEIRFSAVPHIEEVKLFSKEEINSDFINFDKVIWWPWGKLYRADIIRNNNLRYDTQMTFGEDHIFNLLYSKHITGKALISDKIVYNYHFIRGGLASKYYENMNAFQKYIMLKIADYFGGIDSMPYEYKKHYCSNNLVEMVNYYCAWCSYSNAVRNIEKTFEIFSDVSDDEILSSSFTAEQTAMIKSGDFNAFTKNYIKNNPKKTLWRKVRRTVRRFLEFQQKIFLGRK